MRGFGLLEKTVGLNVTVRLGTGGIGVACAGVSGVADIRGVVSELDEDAMPGRKKGRSVDRGSVAGIGQLYCVHG